MNAAAGGEGDGAFGGGCLVGQRVCVGVGCAQGAGDDAGVGLGALTVGVAATVGALFLGEMVTVTVLVVVPPWASVTVTVKVSVLADVGAPMAAAAWRAAAVGV